MIDHDIQQVISRDIAAVTRCEQTQVCTDAQRWFLELTRIESVGILNRTVNLAIQYTKDGDDKWQSPLETLDRKRGDCEDYAILKLAILGYRKIPGSLLIFRRKATDHMVVIFEKGVLDNSTHVLKTPISGEIVWSSHRP